MTPEMIPGVLARVFWIALNLTGVFLGLFLVRYEDNPTTGKMVGLAFLFFINAFCAIWNICRLVLLLQ